MKALFRCDASAKIGGGHVMRCLTLANELAGRGWECLFACNEEAAAIIPALASSKYQRIAPDEWRHTGLLVVDHYGLDVAYEKLCRPRAKKILVIDDLADRPHDCDILMDQTYGRLAADYSGLVPPHCAVLTGTQYALLRPQFATLRVVGLQQRAARKGKLERLLLSFGSGNPDNVTGLVLAALERVPERLEIVTVLGRRAPHASTVAAQIAALQRKTPHTVTLHLGVDDMAGLMARADLSIGAGGTTSWERCCLGLPAMVIELADNQGKIAQELEKAGAIVFLGHKNQWDDDVFLERLRSLQDQPQALRKMAEIAASVCDGKGAGRLAGEVMKKCRFLTEKL